MGVASFSRDKNNYICCHISVRTAVCITEHDMKSCGLHDIIFSNTAEKKGFKPSFLNSRFDNFKPL